MCSILFETKEKECLSEEKNVCSLNTIETNDKIEKHVDFISFKDINFPSARDEKTFCSMLYQKHVTYNEEMVKAEDVDDYSFKKK